jgi:hypothetical protein
MKFPLEPQRTIFHEGIDAYELIKLGNTKNIKFMCFCARQILGMISEEKSNDKLVHEAISHIEAAQRIAKHLDAQDDEVKERRAFWMRQEDHERPLLMHTFSEIVVEYYAEIQK